MQYYDNQVRAISKHFRLKYPKITSDGAPPQDLLTRSATWTMRGLAVAGGAALGYLASSKLIPSEQIIEFSPYAIGFVTLLLAPTLFADRYYLKKADVFTAKDHSLNTVTK